MATKKTKAPSTEELDKALANEEFEVGAAIRTEEEVQEAAAVEANKRANRRARTDKADAAAQKRAQKTLDPEQDKKNWPTIHIEMEEGKPNYEFLAVRGTMKTGRTFSHELQVMRGVDVQVPPSVVNMLRESVATYFAQQRNAITGKMDMIRQNRSSIPWRLITGGKYIK